MAEIGSAAIKVTLDDSGIKTQLAEIKKNIREITHSAKNLGKQYSFKEQRQDAKKINSYFDNMAKRASQIKRDMANVTKEQAKAASSTPKNTIKQHIPTSDVQLQQENKSNEKRKSTMDAVFTSSMKLLKVSVAISAVIGAIQTSINAIVKLVKLTASIYSTLAKTIAGTAKHISKFVYEFSGLKTVVNAVSSGFGYIADNVKKAFSVENIKNFASECVELGSNLIEINNIFDTILSKTESDSMQQWAKSITDTFGLNANSASKYAASFLSMFDSMGGFSDKQMGIMAQNMTKAAADLASFRNIDYETAFNAVQSGLAGQTKGLQKQGISIHQATLQQHLYNKGLDVSITKLTQSQKLFVRHSQILEAMRSYMGDFNKTQFTYANQVRLLGENMDKLKSSVGYVIQGALAPLLIMFNTLIRTITTLIEGPLEKLKTKMQEIGIEFGINPLEYSDNLDLMLSETEDTVAKIKKTVSSFDELHQLNDSDSGIGGGISTEDLIAALNNSYEKMEEEAKSNKWEGIMHSIWNKLAYCWKQKDFTVLGRNLSEQIKKGFEWVNKNKNDIFKTLGGLGTSAATFINGLFEDPELFSEAAKTLKLAIEGMMTTVTDFFKNLDPKAVGTGIGTFISEMFTDDENGLSSIDKFVIMISTAINKISSTIYETLKSMDPTEFGTKIGAGLNDLFNKVDWTSVGITLGSLASSLLETLSAAFQELNWTALGESVDKLIAGIFAPDENGDTIMDQAARVVVYFVNGLMESLNQVLTGDGLSDAGSEISQFFAKVRENLDWSLISENIKLLWEDFKELCSKAIASIDWAKLSTTLMPILFDVIGAGLSTLIAGLGLLLLGLIAKVFEEIAVAILQLASPVLLAIAGLIDSVIGFFKTLWELIKLIFKNIAEGAKEKIEDLKEGFKEFKENALEIFGNLWDGIKNIFSGVADWFKDIFSKAADGIKGALDKVKSWFGWGDDESSEIVGSGKGAWVNLPQYANGGYVKANTPRMAIVGDNRTQDEVISPVDTMYETQMSAIKDFFAGSDFINSMASAIASAIGNSNNGGDVVIPFNLDGQQFAKLTMTQQQINNARKGF